MKGLSSTIPIAVTIIALLSSLIHGLRGDTNRDKILRRLQSFTNQWESIQDELRDFSVERDRLEKVENALRFLDSSNQITKLLMTDEANWKFRLEKINSLKYLLNLGSNHLRNTVKRLFRERFSNSYNNSALNFNIAELKHAVSDFLQKDNQQQIFREIIAIIEENQGGIKSDKYLSRASPYAKYNASQECNMDLSTSVLDMFRMLLKWFVPKDDLINYLHDQIKDAVLDELVDILNSDDIFICNCRRTACDVECCTIIESPICLDCNNYTPIDNILNYLELSLNGTVCQFLNASIITPLIDGFYNIEMASNQEINLLNFLDAMFKVPTGILEGKLHWMGSYEQCLEGQMDFGHWIYSVNNLLNPIFGKPLVEVSSTKANFKGRYCRVEVSSSELVRNGTRGLSFSFGFCISDSCSAQDFGSLLTNGLSLTNLNISSTPINIEFLESILGLSVVDTFCGHDGYRITRPGEKFALGLIIAIIIVVIFATFYDSFIRRRILKRQLLDRKQEIKRRISSLNLEFETIDESWTEKQLPYETRVKPQISVISRQLSYTDKVVENDKLLMTESKRESYYFDR